MAYSRVTRTANGAAALKYAEGNGHGHNGKETRNEFISGVNLVPGVDYAQQMQRYWDKARPNHKTQVLRVVQSFSANEFVPDDIEAGERAHQVGIDMVREHYPGRQAVVFTQRDGEGGYWHNHIIISDVSMEDYRGCDKEQYFYQTIQRWTDAETSKYTTLDHGKEQTADKSTRVERTKRAKGEYVWKDDLKKRIHDAMQEATSEDDFLVKLTEHGVDAVRKHSKKYGEYFTYEMVDTSGVPEDAKLPNFGLKGRSYRLGASYGPEALDLCLSRHRKKPDKVKTEPEQNEKGTPPTTAPQATSSSQQTESEEDGKPDFFGWCRERGERIFDMHGNMDFDKYERLQAEFKEYLENPPQETPEESEPVAATADEELALEELPETVDGKESVDELKARDEKRRQAVAAERRKTEAKMGRLRSDEVQARFGDMLNKLQSSSEDQYGE